MNIPVTLTISLAAALGGNILKKGYTNKTNRGLCSVFLFNSISSIIAAIVFLIWGGIDGVSTLTLWLSIIFGILLAGQTMATMLALQIGPMSLTTMIVSFSTVITALSGAIFWNEKLKLLQIVGIALMLASFVFSVEKKTGEKKATWKWFFLCLLALLGVGGIGILQKVHQASAVKDELNAFLFISFIISSVLSLTFYLVMKRKETGSILQGQKTKKTFIWLLTGMVIAGVFVAVNNKLNLYLSGVMDSAVFFPIVNGGGVVLSTLAALVVFRERLSKKQWFGIVLGITSVVCLCI